MKPWLRIPPQMAHDLAPHALKAMAAFRKPTTYRWRPLRWRGLIFSNPLGIAGGVDKDGTQIEAWWTFGPGFVEIGTVTPRPQSPNPGQIIDRDVASRALWNRLGFPGSGVRSVLKNLERLPSRRHTPIFVNIGRNRETPNDEAVRDYADCIRTLAGLADAFVINISSPNTTGLRELLAPLNLKHFLNGVLAARAQSSAPSTPVLLKLSPDLSDAGLAAVIEIAAGLGVDGFIATNTTLTREERSPFPAEGGVSGQPLAARSKEILRRTVEILRPSRSASSASPLIVSVGGVLDAGGVHERLDLGADLVQVYTALIFEGPAFFRRVAEACEPWRSGLSSAEASPTRDDR